MLPPDGVAKGSRLDVGRLSPAPAFGAGGSSGRLEYAAAASLASSSFGGPWLPRCASSNTSWPPAGLSSSCSTGSTDVDPSAAAGDALAAAASAGSAISVVEYLRARLCEVRGDRARYFEQYLECRELLMSSERLRCATMEAIADCNAGAGGACSNGRAMVRGRTPPPAASTTASKSVFPNAAQSRPYRHASTPRRLLPLKPSPAPRSERQRSSSRHGQRAAAASAAPLTARCPRGSSHTQLLHGDELAPATARQTVNSSLPASTGSVTPPKSAACCSNGKLVEDVFDALDESLRQHMEDRSFMEARLQFWERESLVLAERGQALQHRLRLLSAESLARHVLDDASLRAAAFLELERMT